MVVDKILWKKRLNEALRRVRDRRTVWETISRLNMEITNRCQANCVFCFREEFNVKVPQRDMPLKDAKRFISDVDNFSRTEFKGLKRINLGLNGEPLLHQDVVEIVRYAAQTGAQVRISTNLGLLDEDMSKALLDAGLGSICFSIDEVEKTRFEALRRGLNWETTLRNAFTFKRLRDEGGYNCQIYVNPVSCVENKGREHMITKFWSRVSDQKPVMSREIPIGRRVHRVQPWFNSREHPFCADMFAVKSNGDVLPCCFDIYSDFPLGNLYEQTPKEIYYSDRVEQLRERLANLRDIPFCCRICVILPQMVKEGVTLED